MCVSYSSGHVVGVMGEGEVSDSVSGEAEQGRHILQLDAVHHHHCPTGEPQAWDGGRGGELQLTLHHTYMSPPPKLIPLE